MISIFTTKDNLENICYDNDKKPWLDMIIKLKEVFVNDDYSCSDDEDPEDNPFYILEGMQVTIDSSKKEYINNIPQNPLGVLKNPSGIYLLDISVEDANSISKRYGVICQSISHMDTTPLTRFNHTSELFSDENGKTWKEIISQFKDMPSNSVLIIDRHLFDEDKYDENNERYDERKRVGIDNLYNILDCVLPESFEDTYHVGVLITDNDKAKSAHLSRSNLTNERIANAANKLKRVLNRNFRINIEAVFFDHGDAEGYRLIHNRRIISNYFIVTADHKLAALKNGKGTCNQSISVYPLFENIDRDSDSDKKEKRIRREIKQFQDFIFNQKTYKSPTALLFKNGKKQDDFSTLEHRFLKKIY